MGSRLTIAEGCSTPKTPANQPHWNTATTAPNVAATLSRNPRVAVSGTMIDRNTNMRSRNASPTTSDEGADDEVEEGQHRPIVPGLSERESGFPTPTAWSSRTPATPSSARG